MRPRKATDKVALLIVAAVLGTFVLPKAALAQAAAESAFAAGERLFREDKPEDASKALERAVLDPGADERAYLYLGLCYGMLGRYDDAVAAFRKGAASSLRYKALYYYDMGNAYVLAGKNSFAEEMFGQALAVDTGLAGAYLNRGNVRLALNNYEGAGADYRSYLELKPDDPQKSDIEEVLRRITANVEAQRAAQAAEEARRQAAEAARKALLDEVQASLKASAEDTTNLSAGSGQVQGYGDSLELDQ